MVTASILLLTMGVSPFAQLHKSVASLERSFAHGRIGFGMENLATGERWFYRGDERFPMQSVFKFPLGVAVLDAVDHGRLNLRQSITVGAGQLSVPMSSINERFFREGSRTYDTSSLLRLAVGSSDNTAADLLIEQLGGVSGVMKTLRSMKVGGIRVDRTESQLQIDCAGLGSFRPELASEEGFQAAIMSIKPAEAKAAMNRYLRDSRDSATPRAMVAFFERFAAGKLLSKQSNMLLTTIMRESTTGKKRLHAGLPAGTILAHRTGTGREILGIAGAVNDVGIASLPDGRRFIIAVFVKGASGTPSQREKLIADIARLIVSPSSRG
jgi:beta-lactamase class A